jgi:hypothetical protein
LAGGHVAAATATSEEFENPQRWLLCGGLGAGMIFLYILALLHGANEECGDLILNKVSHPVTIL